MLIHVATFPTTLLDLRGAVAMSSGSKRAPDAGTVLQERELRNIKAKTNVLLHMDAKRQKQETEQDEYEEPGAALKLLEGDKADKGREYGDWSTHHWVAGQPPPQEEEAKVEEEEHDDGEDGGDVAPGEEDAEDMKEEEEPQREEEELPQEEDDQEEDLLGDGTGGGKKGKGKKGKGRGGKKGAAGRKPWWSRYKWHEKGEGGGGGKKGKGKGHFDQWGGEYCRGGYRAVNGEFFPQLGCQLA